MSGKPNIIYILTDDQRAELLGLMGHPVLKTPNLDRLGSEGVVFSNAFCTSPVCTPSRASHLLGQWERKHGVNFNSNSTVSEKSWNDSFPMRLKHNGYFVGWVGKNHVPVGTNGYLNGYMESTMDFWYGNHNHSGFYVKEANNGENYQRSRFDTQVEVFEEGVMNFLDAERYPLETPTGHLPRRPKDQPFCLCVTFNLPHSFGTGSMRLRDSDDELYRTAYRDQMDHIPLPETYVAYDNIQTPRLPMSLYNGVYLPSYDYVKSPESLRERMVRMFQAVTGIDRFVGHLRDELHRLGISQDTLIVFSTDHGIHFGEHGIGGKCFLYEEDIRIPLIIYDPRLPDNLRGQTRDEMVVVPDFAPTVLDLAGVDIPSAMQGTSLKPLITNRLGSDGWRRDLFAEQLMDIQNYPKSECVREKEWKYIRYFQRTEDPAQEGETYRSTLDSYRDFIEESPIDKSKAVYEELYYLARDPREKHNLAYNPNYETKLTEMRDRLLVLCESVKD